jgi:hypothetical protein
VSEECLTAPCCLSSLLLPTSFIHCSVASSITIVQSFRSNLHGFKPPCSTQFLLLSTSSPFLSITLTYYSEFVLYSFFIYFSLSSSCYIFLRLLSSRHFSLTFMLIIYSSSCTSVSHSFPYFSPVQIISDKKAVQSGQNQDL